MLVWHVVAFILLMLELLLFLRVQKYQLGIVIVLLSGLVLASVALCFTSDESCASAPVMPGCVSLVTLVVKEIRRNQSFATKYNPYCCQSGVSPLVKWVVGILALICAIVKIVSLVMAYASSGN